MSHPLLSPRNDIVFKLFFGDARNTDPLTDFLKAALDLPPRRVPGHRARRPAPERG